MFQKGTTAKNVEKAKIKNNNNTKKSKSLVL